MRLKIPLAIAFLIRSVSAVTLAQKGEEKHEQRPRAQRAPAPKFEAHPPGTHPRGPTVRAHQVRVLAPRVVVHGGAREWRHWAHPDFARPVYYWDWEVIDQVTCTAEDSYGDQYPVTENWAAGYGLDNMTTVEDGCYRQVLRGVGAGRELLSGDLRALLRPAPGRVHGPGRESPEQLQLKPLLEKALAVRLSSSGSCR